MYILTQAVLQERKISVLERREKPLSGFCTALVEFYIEEVLRGFLLCGFPEENLCVLMFLCLLFFQ